MNVIFSFDSEDYLTPEAADAEKWWAVELSRRGLRGSFQCVAELIRSLQKCGRQDVIDAMSRHEIGYHSNYHSLPPHHPVALDGMNLAKGMEWIFRRESSGLATLMETFGRMPVSYCPPGDSWTPHCLLAMASAGLKVFCGSPVAFPKPFWYCGLLNVKYHISFESVFEENDGKKAMAWFKSAFGASAKEVGWEGVLVVYTHPTRLATTRFWDQVFYKGALPPRRLWKPAPLRDGKAIARIKDRCRFLLDWIQAMKDVKVIDYAELYARYSRKRMDLRYLLDECGLKPGEERKLALRAPAHGDKLSDSLRNIEYKWPLYQDGFKGEKLRKLFAQLAWTAGKPTGDRLKN